MRKFELFMGCFGNGITVCNKAVMNNGDYKKVAHISPCGNITLYVNENYIPEQDMKSIKETAAKEKQRFIEDFEKRSIAEQYNIITNRITLDKFLEYSNMDIPMEEKIILMRTYYYTIA